MIPGKGENAMKIIIVGCGKIGETLMDRFVHEGHDVVAVDSRMELITDLSNRYDVRCVCGSAVDCDTLKDAGAETAELLLALTGRDELNMLCCFLAKRMGAEHTIARIRNPEFNDASLGFIQRELGLSMAINPELLAAQELYNLLKLPSAVKVEYFSRRSFEMIELRLREGNPLCGSSLQELRSRHSAAFLVCVVQRGADVIIPDGSFVLQSGDRIGLTANPVEMEKLLRSIGLVSKKARDIMLLGGSRIAYYLAKMLTHTGSRVKLIDVNREVCHRFIADIPSMSAIHGDGTHQELLLEEGLLEQDAFVSLTGLDEQNILMAYYAASQKVPKVIAKANRDEMAALADQLGLDSVISPKEITANVLVRYARALQSSLGSSIETLYQLMDGRAEALEFAVTDAAAFTNVPLRELSLKKNVLIAGIIRSRSSIIPTGDDSIQPGDHVVVIAAAQRLNTLEDILK